MPIPKPSADESQDEFIARCAEALADEFPDNDQRVAVCANTYRRAHAENGGEQHVVLVANLGGPVRTEQLHGREHIVVSATLVRSGIVLRNNLGRTVLPESAITSEWANQWNGAPVVTDHPTRRGAAMSARDPDTLNAMGIGWLFRTRAENGALKGDVFIDASRKSAVPDLGVILNKLEAGERVELSTGFPVAVEEVTNGRTDSGEEFDLLLHPTGTDHLAVFATKVGACSVKSGCGLAANHEGPCEVEQLPAGLLERIKQVVSGMLKKKDDGEPVALADALDSATDDFEPAATNAARETTPEEGSNMNRDQMIAHLAEAGTDRAALEALSDCQVKTLYEASTASANNANTENGEGDAWEIAHKYRREAEQLRRDLGPAQNAIEKRRVELLDDLLYNARDLPYSEVELKAMNAAQIEKVYKLAFPAHRSFAGMGGPRIADHSGNVPLSQFSFAQAGILASNNGRTIFDEEVN